jgi:hypothetical protein
LDAYEDGNYTIVIHYDDSTEERTTVWFGMRDSEDPIPQVVQRPVFTSFTQQELLPSPVTIEWEPPASPEINLIWLDLENQETYEYQEYEYGGNATGCDAPLALSEGVWKARLRFGIVHEIHRPDGTDVWCGKVSESDYVFTVVP